MKTGNKSSDVMTPEQRSRCMSRIKSKNTKPEIRLRKALWKKGLRYRIHYNLPGKPDIVFVSGRVAVFVDGCFWHGCPEHSTMPKTNPKFWENKIKGNIARDERVTRELFAKGWLVMRFWEHEIKSDLDGVVKSIRQSLDS